VQEVRKAVHSEGEEVSAVSQEPASVQQRLVVAFTQSFVSDFPVRR